MHQALRSQFKIRKASLKTCNSLSVYTKAMRGVIGSLFVYTPWQRVLRLALVFSHEWPGFRFTSHIDLRVFTIPPSLTDRRFEMGGGVRGEKLKEDGVKPRM